MKIPFMSRKKRQFSLDFSTLADGAIPGMIGATWTIASGKAVNTPTLGTNLFTAGNMETGDRRLGHLLSMPRCHRLQMSGRAALGQSP